jgi:bis(5'-nucleosyl)-tetraphosphatase (symmetrical)
MTLYAIGDIQGCARSFEALLQRIDFAPGRDQVWLVGDLVNRGPRSLKVLRRVRELGASATVVLGNHDLHLLATAAGVRRPAGADTFDDVLGASDADELIHWLCQQPLIVRDKAARRVLVHAGIPPVWKVRQAVAHAAEIEALLRSRHWVKALRGMYGQTPVNWDPELNPTERRRFTLNALTRLRFCTRAGRLDLSCSGPPGSQPAKLMPWFDVPGRRSRKWHIVFGHWSALGIMQRDDITAVDSGCVWGRRLTAVPLDPPGKPVSVRCRD